MNVYLFFLQGIHVHPESVEINTTPSILTRCYEEHLQHVCVCSHTHTHTHSFSYIRLQLLTITLLIALVKIRENLEVLSFILFFPPKLSMKSALLRFRILLNLLQYLTLHEFVNNCLLLPRPEDKKKKRRSQPSGLTQSL